MFRDPLQKCIGEIFRDPLNSGAFAVFGQPMYALLFRACVYVCFCIECGERCILPRMYRSLTSLLFGRVTYWDSLHSHDASVRYVCSVRFVAYRVAHSIFGRVCVGVSDCVCVYVCVYVYVCVSVCVCVSVVAMYRLRTPATPSTRRTASSCRTVRCWRSLTRTSVCSLSIRRLLCCVVLCCVVLCCVVSCRVVVEYLSQLTLLLCSAGFFSLYDTQPAAYAF